MMPQDPMDKIRHETSRAQASLAQVSSSAGPGLSYRDYDRHLTEAVNALRRAQMAARRAQWEGWVP